jgi:hypothetical protein
MIAVNLLTAAMTKMVVARLKGRRRRSRIMADPQRREAERVRRREQSKRKYEADRGTPTRMEARTERARQWREKNRPKAREASNAARIKRCYGLAREDWQALHDAQGGRCAICRREQKPHRDGTLDRLSVDHDHQTGRVRGLLCHDCNHVLGKMDDDPERLRAAAAYLERTCTSG